MTTTTQHIPIQKHDTYLDPKIWGPHFWFVLQTISLQYPNKPTETIKKKYYRFFTDLQDFLPNHQMKTTYARFLKEFPLSPYLDSRLSLLKWVHFIHNKYNVMCEKEPIEFYRGMELYYEMYKSDEHNAHKQRKQRIQYIVMVALTVLIVFGVYVYS